MISIKNLRIKLDGKVILNDLNLELKTNESLAIIGASGSGKSVLIKCILDLLPIESGEILIKGRSIKNLKPAEKQQILSSIGMLFQGGALFDSLTIWENVAFGLMWGKGMKPEKAKDIALNTLRLVDLEESIAPLMPSMISGGMQKRVALARALAMDPEIMFLDEPTTGLDPLTSDIVSELIKKTIKESKISALTITHDVNSLMKIADSVAFLHNKKIIWRGALEELKTTEEPHVKKFLSITGHR